MPTCNVITPVHVLGSFVHSRPLIHSFGNLKEKEAIDLKKKKSRWQMGYSVIFYISLFKYQIQSQGRHVSK